MLSAWEAHRIDLLFLFHVLYPFMDIACVCYMFLK